MKVLVTGGAGFIGHHLIEHILKNTDWSVVSLDRLDTSGTLDRLSDLGIWAEQKQRVTIVHHDLKAALNEHVRQRIGDVDVILHLAASSHVDRSIDDPMSFVLDNVVGTCHLLEYARTVDRLQTFLYFSTDEVFGPAPDTVRFQEWDRYKSGNPYAASKAGAEELCVAYHNTYRLPVMITHTMNCYGQRQSPEKYIPSTIRKILSGEIVIVHADATKTRPGSRFYIHARNVASAVLFLLEKGQWGEKYNIVGEREVDNMELAFLISQILDRQVTCEMVDFHSSRPGHDLRYALDGSKMSSLGWKLPVDFENSLRRTVQWYTDHPEWL